MADLTAAREWVKRARELLNAGKLSEKTQELEGLGREFELLMQDPQVQKALAPELGLAMGQLAQSLTAELDLDGELSPDDREARRLFEDFRDEFVRVQKSLAPVLTPSEAPSFALALELADGQAGVRQFEGATRVLQQSWHRLTVIRDEGRQGALQPKQTPDEPKQEDLLRSEALQLELKKASQELALRLNKLDPLSPAEKLQCSVFSMALPPLMGRQRFDDALLLVESWIGFLDEIIRNDGPNSQRREQERQRRAAQQRAAQKLEQLGAAKAIEEIEQAARLHQQRLVEISRLLSAYNGGQPHALESQIGPLVFEVGRQVQRLRARETNDERAQRDFARVLAQAEAAVLALEKKKNEAEGLLQEAKQALAVRLEPRKKALSEFLAEKNSGIESQQRDVDSRQQQLDQQLLRGQQLTDSVGKKIANPFAENTVTFYRNRIKALEPKETAAKNKKPTITEPEKKELQAARLLVAAYEKKLQLEEALAQSNQRLKTLEEERDKGKLPLEAAVESAKPTQQIAWTAPEGIVYGTPLSERQLNATLSAGDGRIEYRHAGKLIEPGKTLLPAGLGQELEAVVVGADHDTFQVTPPKKVKIDVAKAKVTLSCASALQYAYGTPFSTALLSASVTTEPELPGELPGLLAALSCKASGQLLKARQVLDAKEWALAVQCPGNANFEPSNEVEVALTVTPAQQEIVWAGAAPTTFTFGTPLVAQQLNASVKVTTDPPLADQWVELTQALEYVDEKDQPVKLGTLLAAGNARRITARTPVRANFAAAAPQSVEFKVEKATRTLSTGTPPAIGAVVQSADLKKLGRVYKLTLGKGVVEYLVGKLQLSVGAKVAPGKKLAFTVRLQPDDNYQPTPEQTHEIEVLGFADKFDAAKQTKATLLTKTVHTQHSAAVNLLQQQVEALGAASDEDKFAKINALLEEIEEIEANLVTWQGPVRNASPSGDPNLLKVEVTLPDNATEPQKTQQKEQKTVDVAKKLIKHGGMKLADVEKLVPKGTANTYSPSGNYPDGFKYTWTTPSGVTIEVYGHGPTVANNVPATSDSKKGNLVRVMINGQYLKPDGTLTPVATDSTSHMALY